MDIREVMPHCGVLWVSYRLKMDTCYTLHINMRRFRAARVALL